MDGRNKTKKTMQKQVKITCNAEWSTEKECKQQVKIGFRKVKNAESEGWYCSENTPIAPLVLSPDGGMNACCSMCYDRCHTMLLPSRGWP